MTVDEGMDRFVRMRPPVAGSAFEDLVGIERQDNQLTTEI